MTYIIEPWDSITLTFTDGPYVPPAPLAITLEFLDGEVIPPLPWVKPKLHVVYSAPMGRATASQGLISLPLTPGIPADDIRVARWGRAVASDLGTALTLADAGHMDRKRGGAWGNATAAQMLTSLPWDSAPAIDATGSTGWNTGTRADRVDFVSSWIMKTAYRDRSKAFEWFSVNLTGSVYDDSAAVRALLNTDTATTVTLDGIGGPVEVLDWNNVRLAFGYTAPARPIVPHDKTMHVTARQAAEHDAIKRIPWGEGQSAWQDWNLPYPVEDNPPPTPEPTDPPERKTVYIIMNTLQTSDVATGTPLDIQNVNVSLDIDSLSWKFTGTVYGQGTLDLVRPDESGMKDISVTINGHAWVFAIERYTSDEKFPTQKFNISGVSRTQYMAAPFAPVHSYTNSVATTAAQAANAVLENTGFTLTWPTGGDHDLPSWPIPIGALSYRDKSPAQVIAQIVTAAGGVLIPNRDSDGWTVQPRYKISPWHWDSATPDTAIYAGMIRSRSAQFEPAQAYDSCFVSGVNQGVSVDVQLTGSGGLNPMPDVFDDLITDSQAAISRGRNELAATGNKVVETLSVLVPENGAAPGVLIPGMIVSVTHEDPAADYTGLVLSNSIAAQRAGAAEIYQTVTLERRA